MRIQMPKCPFCGGVSELVFKIPVFGTGGCEIKCVSCGARVSDFNYSESHFTEKTLSTIVTTQSIIRCIQRTVEKWNKRVGDS